MNAAEQIEQIELSLEQAKESIDMMDSLQTLTKNKDFVNVITKGYFESEASRLVLLKATPQMASKEDQELLLKSIDSIGFLRQYFVTIMQIGRMAIKAKEEDETTHAELMNEAI